MKKIYKDKNVVRIGNLQIMQQRLTTFWERQSAKKSWNFNLTRKITHNNNFQKIIINKCGIRAVYFVFY